MPLWDWYFAAQFQLSESYNIQLLEESCGICVDREQGCAQFRAEFTQLMC
jgi:hypothetical protein